MRLVLTLVVRDEADIVAANLAFHLAAGVDLAVVLDNGSRDGTLEILESFERTGLVHVVREPGAHVGRASSQTSMARLAASEFGADWVITCDADQFYWPRGGTLKEVLAAVPTPYNVVTALRRVFVPRPAREASFVERMIARVAGRAPINDPTSPFRPQSNVAHRADSSVEVAPGNRGISGVPVRPVPGWHPIEVLHFPLRSREQGQRKYVDANPDWLRNAVRARAVASHREGRFRDYYDALVVDDETLERGLEDGSIAIDTRLRDLLRVLRTDAADLGPADLAVRAAASPVEFPTPSLADDLAYALDLAALAEADAVRDRRRLDELDRRLSELEWAGRRRVGAPVFRPARRTRAGDRDAP